MRRRLARLAAVEAEAATMSGTDGFSGGSHGDEMMDVERERQRYVCSWVRQREKDKKHNSLIVLSCLEVF